MRLAAAISMPCSPSSSQVLTFRSDFLEAIPRSTSGIDGARLEAYASSAFEMGAVIKWLA